VTATQPAVEEMHSSPCDQVRSWKVKADDTTPPPSLLDNFSVVEGEIEKV
jgi:hypothetical protein